MQRECIEILQLIAEIHKPQLINLVQIAMALTLRCDGSVDRIESDKINNLLIVVSKCGEVSNAFPGCQEHAELGTTGVTKAILLACCEIFGPSTYKFATTSVDGYLKIPKAFHGVSSVVTDSTSWN